MPSNVARTVPRLAAVSEISALLDSPEVSARVAERDGLRWTGRKGYPTRSLVGACLVKSLYAIPTWSRTARLVAEHDGLQAALGAAPSVYACYRFATKLRQHSDKLTNCLDAILASLAEALPGMGEHVAVDATDMPGFSNGQRYGGGGLREEPCSDPDAAWGFRSAVSTRKGGGFFGFKLHAVAC